MSPPPDLAASPDRPILALDAMGVLYAAGDDVAELLIPFAQGKGSSADSGTIERAYLAASLGRIDAPAFWRRIGLDPAVEDEYLAGHRLVDGVHDLLAAAANTFGAVCCISNDVAAWSVKLRRIFGIEKMIAPWLISGDLGVRKPDLGIYREALVRLGVPAHRIFFVDDRVKNLDAARRLGMNTILFDPAERVTCIDHLRIGRLSDVLDPVVLRRASNKPGSHPLAARERILQAAHALFLQCGYGRISVDVIAAAAGVTKRTLYRHFRSKDDLLADVVGFRGALPTGHVQKQRPMDLAEFIDDLFEEATLPSTTAGWMSVGSTKIALELAHLPGHPAHAIARRHKREREAWLSRELCARHVGDSADIARDIMLLLEGCLLLALIHGDRTYAARAAGAAKLLTTAACTPAFTPPPANTALVR